jgi:hypothetical protein
MKMPPERPYIITKSTLFDAPIAIPMAIPTGVVKIKRT